MKIIFYITSIIVPLAVSLFAFTVHKKSDISFAIGVASVVIACMGTMAWIMTGIVLLASV